jgi:hypothetical protein
MEENTAKYKSLGCIVDALSATIMLNRSIMRYARQGEKFGG